MSDEPAPEERRAAQAVNLFDLRRIIGGVFTVLGLLLIILGAFDSQQEIDRAAGVRINLWAGIGMLVLGLLFLLWAFTRPLSEQLADADVAAAGSDEASRGTGRDRERAGGEAGPGRQ